MGKRQSHLRVHCRCLALRTKILLQCGHLYTSQETCTFYSTHFIVLSSGMGYSIHASITHIPLKNE